MIKCENACPLRKFEGCCHKCPEFSTCPASCEETPNECGQAIFDEETALQEFKSSQLATLNAIADLTARKKAMRGWPRNTPSGLRTIARAMTRP